MKKNDWWLIYELKITIFILFLLFSFFYSINIVLYVIFWSHTQFDNIRTIWRQLSNTRSHFHWIRRDINVSHIRCRSPTTRDTAWPSQKSNTKNSGLLSLNVSTRSASKLFLCSIYCWAHPNDWGFHKSQRGLEVRSHGLGQTVSVDIHVSRTGRYRWNHPASAHTLRRSNTNRQEIFRICKFCSRSLSSIANEVYAD